MATKARHTHTDSSVANMLATAFLVGTLIVVVVYVLNQQLATLLGDIWRMKNRSANG